MDKFFKDPFDFDGDGELDPFELGTEFLIFHECTKDDDEEEEDWEADWDDDGDDWDDEDKEDEDF